MISLVMPCYNEGDVLQQTYRSVVKAADDWDEPFELLLVDDGSTDATWSIVESLAERDPRVSGIQLSRNFGHQAAIGAGLERAGGDAVVVLDADLQDPPELIGRMIQRWREGYQVVYAQRTSRQGESVLKRTAGYLFYRVLDRLTDHSIPRDTGDFALLDAAVVRQLVAMPEQAMFWRGLRCWAGFRQTAVSFDRPGRAGGKSKYTLRKLLGLAANGLLSFSTFPLRFPAYVGSAALGMTALAAGVSLLRALLFPDVAWPITPTMLVVAFFGSVQLISLGVMGEHLNRLYSEVRRRPRWIVQSTVGKVANDELQPVERHRAA